MKIRQPANVAIIPENPDSRLRPAETFPFFQNGQKAGEFDLYAGTPYLFVDALGDIYNKWMAKWGGPPNDKPAPERLYAANLVLNALNWRALKKGIDEGWLVVVGWVDHHTPCKAALKYFAELGEELNEGYDVQHGGLPVYIQVLHEKGADHLWSSAHAALFEGIAKTKATVGFIGNQNFDGAVTMAMLMGLGATLRHLAMITNVVDAGRLDGFHDIPDGEGGVSRGYFEARDDAGKLLRIDPLTFEDVCRACSEADGLPDIGNTSFYHYMEEVARGGRGRIGDEPSRGMAVFMFLRVLCDIALNGKDAAEALAGEFGHIVEQARAMKEACVKILHDDQFAWVVDIGTRTDDGTPIKAYVVNAEAAKRVHGDMYLTTLGQMVTDTYEGSPYEGVHFLLVQTATSILPGVRVPAVTCFPLTELTAFDPNEQNDGETGVRIWRLPMLKKRDPREAFGILRDFLAARWTVRGNWEDVISTLRKWLAGEPTAWVRDEDWAQALPMFYGAKLLEPQFTACSEGAPVALVLNEADIRAIPAELAVGYTDGFTVEIGCAAFGHKPDARHTDPEDPSSWSSPYWRDVEIIAGGHVAVVKGNLPETITYELEGDKEPRKARIFDRHGFLVVRYDRKVTAEQAAYFTSKAVHEMNAAA